MRWSLPGRRALLAALVLALGPAGCESKIGTLHPVRGSVMLADGTPLTKGMVIFERTGGGPAVTARGELKSDGSCQLGTQKPGDGVPAGKYRVHLNPMDRSEVPDEEKTLPYDHRYLKAETSGLEFEVKAGPSNAFSFALDKPAPKEAPKDEPKDAPKDAPKDTAKDAPKGP